jgi:EAL and modified HD-GYP domain-containing signal transduction protein
VVLTLIGEDKPAELVTAPLVRAQLCEQLGAEASLPDTQADLFRVGLLSTLDAMLDRPMEEVLGQMSVSEDVRERC